MEQFFLACPRLSPVAPVVVPTFIVILLDSFPPSGRPALTVVAKETAWYGAAVKILTASNCEGSQYYDIRSQLGFPFVFLESTRRKESSQSVIYP